jgi:hypothetical protein
MLNVEPRLVKSRTLKQLADFDFPATDNALPNRITARKDMLDPISRRSKTETAEPNRQ